MEMFVMAVVVIAAFAAVLVPLFRRRPGRGDPREFENVPPRDEPPAAPPADPEPPPPSASEPPAATQGAGEAAPAGDLEDADDVELELGRYRQAVRAGTVCRRCGQANPAGSRYCFECGAQLPAEEAREFE